MGDVIAMYNYRQAIIALVLRPRIETTWLCIDSLYLPASVVRGGGMRSGQGGPRFAWKAQLHPLLVLWPRILTSSYLGEGY